MHKGFCLAALFALLVASGCGGGGGRGKSQEPIPSGFSFGRLIGDAAASNPPVTTNTSSVVATGFTGSFTALRLRDQNTDLAETRIYYVSSRSSPGQIWSCSQSGTDHQLVGQTGVGSIAVSSTGRIAFTKGGNIMMMNADGSGVSTAVTNAFEPSWNASGLLLTFSRTNGANTEIRTVNPATGLGTLVTSTTTLVSMPQFASNGDVFYLLGNRSFPGSKVVRRTSTGTFVGELSMPTAAADQAIYSFAVSPDGEELALYTKLNSEGRLWRASQVSMSAVGPERAVPFTLHVGTGNMWFSPDSQKIVLSVGPNLYVTNRSGGGLTTIANVLDQFWDVAWAPFPRERALLGSTGILGPRAAGIIVGQKGALTTSVLAFDAVTPTSVILRQQTGLNSTAPNLIYSLDGDNINMLRFANYADWKPVTAVGSGQPVTNANGALISLDGLSGAVVAVLPFTGTRNAKPTVLHDGLTTILRGSFVGVFDGQGNNLAPDGASEVRISSSQISVGG